MGHKSGVGQPTEECIAVSKGAHENGVNRDLYLGILRSIRQIGGVSMGGREQLAQTTIEVEVLELKLAIYH